MMFIGLETVYVVTISYVVVIKRQIAWLGQHNDPVLPVLFVIHNIVVIVHKGVCQ